jgi:predicted nucleic acid-binding protein
VSVTYIDSSALVKLVVREAETEPLRRFVAVTTHLTSSILAVVELSRAVARVAPEARSAVAAVMEAVAVVGFDDRIAARAAALGPASLRTLDAIHLATALEFGGELDAFVCYDDRLAEAARTLGLPAVAPN